MIGIYRDIDVEEIREKLYNNIKESLENRNISLQEKEALDKFIQYICDEYKTTLSHSSIEIEINKIIKNTNKIINQVKQVVLIILAIDFILLFVLNLKSVYKLFLLVGISIFICGFTLATAVSFVKFRLKIHTITVLNDIISDIIRNTLSSNLNLILKYGLILIFIGIILIFISNLIHIKTQLKKQKKM